VVALAMSAHGAVHVYRAGLDYLSVSKRDTVGLRAPELRVILKTLPRFGTGGVVTRSSAAMAFDSTATSALDSILKGIKPPRDQSTHNDFRR
jgi:hypothetical protein